MITIIGAGDIATEYGKILRDLDKPFRVITRGKTKALEFKLKFPDIDVLSGGHSQYLQEIGNSDACIIAAPAFQLADITKDVIGTGLKRILVEKPLALNKEQLVGLDEAIMQNHNELFIAYNRRNYVSIKAAQEICNKDGGILSVHFDFTEALFRIPDTYGPETLSTWGLSNSTHIIDTVFSLIGKPQSLNATHYGQNKIEWHKHASTFIGNGISEKQIPFSYHANWSSAGRWNIEIMTSKRKLLLSPMEMLKEQVLGTFQINEVELNYDVDKKYKPGYFNQCVAFLAENDNELLGFDTFKKLFPFYIEILGYKG